MKPTARELLADAIKRNPGRQFYLNSDETALGVWSEDDCRVFTVAALMIDGTWGRVPYDLLVDGKPAWPQDKWQKALD